MKKIFNLIIAITALCLYSVTVIGQSGIYMTADDYARNKPGYTCANKNEKIHLHSFFYNAPEITVIQETKKIMLNKRDVYGFKDKKGNSYRFYKKIAYRIVEAGHLYIYTLQQNIAQSKGFEVVNVYYFSTSATGDIMRLTMDNLKYAYRHNDRFLDLLDIYFGAYDVTKYDDIHKTYKINYVFKKTIAK